MAKLPVFKRIQREDFPDAPAWVDRLLYPLNKFFEGVYAALNQNLTFTENLATGLVSLEFETPATYKPPIVAARYSSNAGASHTSNTNVDYEDKETDTHNAVTTGSSWRFTAPVSGMYHVDANVACGSQAWTANQNMYMVFKKNGLAVNMLDFWRCQTSATYPGVYLNGGTNIWLDAGDYIELVALHSVSPLTLYASPDYNNISIIGHALSGQSSDDFAETVKFANPLKNARPQGVALVSLYEKDYIDTPIYEAFSVSWRLDAEENIEIGYIPGLKAGTKYVGRFLVL